MKKLILFSVLLASATQIISRCPCMSSPSHNPVRPRPAANAPVVLAPKPAPKKSLKDELSEAHKLVNGIKGKKLSRKQRRLLNSAKVILARVLKDNKLA